MNQFIDALLLQSGYNATLVTIGASLLGFSAGSSGTFLFLRKRALVSDATAHATLPGIGLAFIIMVSLGGDGRSMIGLMLGSAVTATIGLIFVEWITRCTRLAEDAAIGAVLGSFFGLGIVLLTIIQTMSTGRQAGLEDFLLGSTAGMLFNDGVIIAVGGSFAVFATLIFHRPMTLVAFDAEYAAVMGYDVRKIDLIMMGIVMGVTVIGLKLVGLILIVALLIIPPVAARFWTDRSNQVIWIAGIIGGVSGYIGAVLSALAPAMPTGPLIVLTAAAIFLFSLLFAPKRGVAASVFNRRRFQARVHRRQGLLSLSRQEPIREPFTLRLLLREGLIRPDGVPTDSGRAKAAKVARDERRWDIAREVYQDAGLTGHYDGLTPIEEIFTLDEIQEFDRRIGPPVAVGKFS